MEYINLVLDFILHIDTHLATLIAAYGWWIYGILFVIVFCETGLVVTPFLPGDSLLFMAGTLAGIPHNNLNVHLLLLVLVVAAVLGDALNYAIGRKSGEYLFSNPKSKIFRRAYLRRTQVFYTKHGGKTIILARFVPIIRTFAPFVAGMGKMSYRMFATYNVVGGTVWVAFFLYIGYWFGNLPFVQRHLHVALIAVLVLSALPLLIDWLAHRRRKKSKG